ncbi:MAG: hypothetical protein LBR15_06335 [Methanobrevibacter sp.]|jgi:hypothetical protein|nr:hypothetical protein [Candidatus Methanovirga australis]
MFLILILLKCIGDYTTNTYWIIKFKTRINNTSKFEYELKPAEKAYERVIKLELKIKELKSNILDLATYILDNDPNMKPRVLKILEDL